VRCQDKQRLGKLYDRKPLVDAPTIEPLHAVYLKTPHFV